MELTYGTNWTLHCPHRMLHVTTQISISCEILLYHQTTNSAMRYVRHHLISMLHRFQCDAPLTQCTLANAILLRT